MSESIEHEQDVQDEQQDESPATAAADGDETGAEIDATVAASSAPEDAEPAGAGDEGAGADGEEDDSSDEDGEESEGDEDGDDAEDGEPEKSEAGRRKRSSKADQLEAEGDVAADYLEELLDIADLDGDIDTFVEGGRAHVSVVTDVDTLVGPKGEVLEALQELSRLAVMTETGVRSRLMLDIAGHRERRRQELQDVARDAISEVTSTGEAARLAPMNPFERKIVHDAVAAAGLVSESEGVEPQRRVVVLPQQ